MTHYSIHIVPAKHRANSNSHTLAVIYAHTTSHTAARSLLQSAIENLMASIDESPKPQIPWSLHYDQQYTTSATNDDYDTNINCPQVSNPHVLKLPDLNPGLVLEDDVLKHVRAAWRKIMGEDEGFMIFGEREGMGEEGIEEDDGET